MNRMWRAAESFDPRGLPLSLVRSLLALAQMTAVMCSPSRLLFYVPPGWAPWMRCAGLKGPTLWCVVGHSAWGERIGQGIAVSVLTAVLIGYRPRWTCVAHYYIAFSIAADATAANGGDGVAEILTMLLIPICLGDPSRWSWRRPALPLPPAWRGSAFAAHTVLRCQTAAIYLYAVVAKLVHPVWQRGTAMGILAHDPEFGFPGAVRPLAQQLLGHSWATELVTWLVLVVETAIALSMAFGPRLRRYGLMLAVLLHAAIILLMGLFGFGLIMIALVLADCLGAPVARPVRGRLLRALLPVNVRGETS